MPYFDGIDFGTCDHVPACEAWIDRCFPHFHALNYAHSGRIRWSLDGGRTIILNAPVAWWTTRGTRHRYRYGRITGETWDHYYATLNGPRASAIFREWLGPPVKRRPYTLIADSASFRQKWENFLEALNRGGSRNNAWAIHSFEGLVLQATEAAPPPVTSSLDDKIEKLKAAIQASPSSSWLWEIEAKRLGLSLVHLRRLFRQRTGQPLHQYLLKARLDEAAHLLRSTELTLKAIAERTGIPDIYYFGKLFKAAFHLPPATYRHEMQALYGLSPMDGAIHDK